MPHSMPIAEPLGVLAGVIAGRMGSKIGRALAVQIGLPTWLGVLAGSTLTHYLSSALTKAFVNTAMVDPIGGTANITVTSPLTSIAHGALETLADLLPDAAEGGLIEELLHALQEELPASAADVASLLSEGGIDPSSLGDAQLDSITDAVAVSTVSAPTEQFVPGGIVESIPQHQPHFGGFGGDSALGAIADSQGRLPTCFPESVENMLQLYWGDAIGSANGVSDQVLEFARTQGWAEFNPVSQQWVIPNQYHQAVISAYGVPTELSDFSHEYFQSHLAQQCPIQLGVDSAYFGNPVSASHSVTLVDFSPGPDGQGYYRVLDSANPQGQWYPASVVEQGARSALLKWPDGINGRALVAKLPALRWPFRT